MRSLLFILFLPLAAFGATPPAPGPVRCDSSFGAVKLSSDQLASAKQTEVALRERSMTPDMTNVDAINLLSLSQHERYHPSEANATAHMVAEVWKREAPSAAIAARAHAHARQQLGHTNCIAAEALYAAALEIARKAVGESHMLTVEIMNDLAVLYRVQRRLPERTALYGRIAAALRADPSLGARLPQIHLEMSDIAYRNKDYSEAEKHARAAMAHPDNGAESPPLALVLALNEAAAALYGQGKLQEGDKLRDRAKSIDRQMAAARGVTEVQVQKPPADSVASLYKLGQIDAALAMALQRLRVSEAKEAELTAAFTALHADPMSQPASASEARKRALAFGSRGIEAQQRETVYALSDAAELHQSQERLAEAEALYRRAFKMLTSEKAGKSQVAGRLARGLGIILRKKGELKEAERFQKIAYANGEAELGPDHPDALEAQAELAHLFAAQGNVGEAAKLYASLATREELRLDADRSILSEHLMPLADLQMQQGDLSAAESNFVKVAQLWRQGGTKNDQYLMASLGSLARLYSRQGKTAQAKGIDAQLAALRRSR